MGGAIATATHGSGDANGNLATSGDFTLTTLPAAPPADTTPPSVAAVGSSNVTDSSATIAWTTDESADTQVEYGPTIAYGSSTVLDPALVTSHSQNLGGLLHTTLYHYRVK